MTPQTIITSARDTLNDEDDTGAELFRTSNAKLLSFVNDGIAEVSILNPALFNTLGDMDCIPNQCDQKVSFVEAQTLVDVLCIHDGNVVPECDMASMDAFLPGWRTATPAAAINWMRKPNDPLRFFVYPPAPDNQTLDVLYIKNQTAVTLNQIITELPASLHSALASYIIYRSEMRDDEHVNSNRATAAYERFVTMVKGATA